MNQQLDTAEEELKSFKEKSTAKEDKYTSTIEQLTEVCLLSIHPCVCVCVHPCVHACACEFVHTVYCQVKITLGNQIMALDQQVKQTQGQCESLKNEKVNIYLVYHYGN